VTTDVNGILVPAADDAALAAGILTLLQDPNLRDRFRAASRARASDFDIRTTVALEEAAYKRLVGSP